MRALPQTAKLQGKKRAYADVMDEKRLTITIGKGKNRGKEEIPPPLVKKPKRAETRPCPVCNESIPLRLMALHAQLESERVDEIVKQIGLSEPILLAHEFDDLSRPGPSTGARSRRSAVKALRSFTTSQTFSSTNEQITKTIQTIQRHRKQRHTRFKELAREEQEGYLERSRWAQRTDPAGDEAICPVCSRAVRGDQEVIDAHVDACLAHEFRRLEEERITSQESVAADEEGWGDTLENVLQGGGAGHVGNVRGTGFHTRDPAAQDVEDDIDIDGDDREMYGEAQFTEGDILPVDGLRPAELNEDVEVEIEGDLTDEADSAQKTLRDLIAEGKTIHRRTPLDDISGGISLIPQIDEEPVTGGAEEATISVKKRGRQTLNAALKYKTKHSESSRMSSSSPLLCRICLEQYNEPTVSTGCWHTCCRECWLRCLGSTKLCPICKRITGATDLRRIYL